MSAAGSSNEEHNDAYIADKLTSLCELPTLLANADEHEVLEVAIRAVIRAFPAVGYVRILLVGENLQPSDLLEWAHNKQFPTAMAELQEANTSQEAAMRRAAGIHTQQLQPGAESNYADWQLLQQQFGMQSCAAVPLMVSGTVHGVIVAASPQPRCFNPRTMQLLEVVANMLAPYAALTFKYEQIKSTRRLMARILPERVVDATIQRLQIGGLGTSDLFVNTHYDVQQPQQEQAPPGVE